MLSPDDHRRILGQRRDVAGQEDRVSGRQPQWVFLSPELDRISREREHSEDTDELLISSALAFLCGELVLRRCELGAVPLEGKP